MIVMYWSSPDGEEYFGSPELFGDQQDQQEQQEYVNQGKYSMALPCCPTHFKHFTLNVYNIANYKDILAVDDNYLVPKGFYCIWVEVLVL